MNRIDATTNASSWLVLGMCRLSAGRGRAPIAFPPSRPTALDGIAIVATVIFKRVSDGRPYPEHGLRTRDWAQVAPRQVRLDELVTTKDTLQRPPCSTRTPRSTATCSPTSWSGEATSTSKTACTGRCARRSSSATCCTPGSWSWRADGFTGPLGGHPRCACDALPRRHPRRHQALTSDLPTDPLVEKTTAISARTATSPRTRRSGPTRSRSASTTPAADGAASRVMKELQTRGFAERRQRQRPQGHRGDPRPGVGRQPEELRRPPRRAPARQRHQGLRRASRSSARESSSWSATSSARCRRRRPRPGPPYVRPQPPGQLTGRPLSAGGAARPCPATAPAGRSATPGAAVPR